MFCEKNYKHGISNHLVEAHRSEHLVQDLLQCPMGSLERKCKVTLLVNKGNFRHNCQVINVKYDQSVFLRSIIGANF